MAIQLVPCLLLLSITSSSSHAKAQPCECECPDNNSDHDRARSNYTTDRAGFQNQLIDKDTGVLHDSSAFPQKTGVLCTIDRWIQLWQKRPDGGVDEASFSVTIEYQPVHSQYGTNHAYRGIAFLILPRDALGHLEADNSALAKQLVASVSIGTLNLSNDTSRNASVSSSSVSVKIGSAVLKTARYSVRIMGVDITIDPGPVADAASSNYSVWIDYDRVGRSLAVYVDAVGKPKPDNTIAEVRFLSISSGNVGVSSSPGVYFGILSTMEQAFDSGIRWAATIEDLPYYYTDNGGGFLSRKVTILSSVLGSVATTAVIAVSVACYFNSRYRRWHSDLDQLARSMERLPGVPTKVDFADIKKATGNFHETMKLGGGGFGTVYMCTLPAAASKTERPMEVAVKRFTRDVRNHCYDDFLAEVSIINRLRHKNIVPLIGWSYNKGEPLLVFEFMKNGSLDQHLFPRGGNSSSTGQRYTGVTIRQWATRYEIIRDIATGLHYVHHEYEPMVLHRDIKASNVMLDLSFCARLGDFGLACTVAIDRNSATGIAGTWGYIAPEYAVCGKATRQTDIYALGVLILEVVTGQRALANQVVDDDDVHITDRVWRFHQEGRLLECLDPVLIVASSPDNEEYLDDGGDAERLLLLGLACSSPNPKDRPTMAEVVRVITKSALPPVVPLMKPRFVWPPPEWVALGGDDSVGTSMQSLNISMGSITERPSQFSLGQPKIVSRTYDVRERELEHSVSVTAASALGSGETRRRV
ncbi:hypothetical protein ZWY2020_006879 [Hordeum vulgare]|nr:hypothetical protein ZWY2020_006879 [Hordeum vulgare]